MRNPTTIETKLFLWWAPWRPANYVWVCSKKVPDGWRIFGFNLGCLLVRLWVRQVRPGMVQ